MEELSTTNISTTACGHTYHFQCLYIWTRTHTTCPLCRTSFPEPVVVEDELPESLVGWGGPIGNPDPVDVNLAALVRAIPNTVNRINQAIRQVNINRPFEEFTGEIDHYDVSLVMEQTDVDEDTANAYIRYHNGDLLNTIVCLLYGEYMPIPGFRVRPNRPAAEPSYVSQVITTRVAPRRHEVGAERGYESS
jgi:NACalpha-BTF3-like transcription factor